MRSTQRLNHNMHHTLEEAIALTSNTSWIEIVVLLLKAGCSLDDIAQVLATVRPITAIIPNVIEEYAAPVIASHGENL